MGLNSDKTSKVFCINFLFMGKTYIVANICHFYEKLDLEMFKIA